MLSQNVIRCKAYITKETQKNLYQFKVSPKQKKQPTTEPNKKTTRNPNKKIYKHLKKG